MPAFLIPLIAGAAGLVGAALSNKSNQKEAGRNRDFQREMSNTAVARSVADYKRSGLNPALAYDRSASSPSGGTAALEDIVERGSSSAREWKQQNEAMKLAKNAQDVRNETERTAQAANLAASGRDIAAAKFADAQANQAIQTLHYNLRLQPKQLEQLDHNNRIAAAQAKLTELGIPAATNAANFENMMGKGGPILNKAVLPALQALRLLRGK